MITEKASNPYWIGCLFCNRQISGARSGVFCAQMLSCCSSLGAVCRPQSVTVYAMTDTAMQGRWSIPFGNTHNGVLKGVYAQIHDDEPDHQGHNGGGNVFLNAAQDRDINRQTEGVGYKCSDHF